MGDLAVIGRKLLHNQAENGGFADAVGPQQKNLLAPVQLKI